MLGSASDAEDVVQETWLRWAKVDHKLPGGGVVAGDVDLHDVVHLRIVGRVGLPDPTATRTLGVYLWISLWRGSWRSPFDGAAMHLQIRCRSVNRRHTVATGRR